MARLVVLMDALAPSASAVLHAPVLMPTVTPSPALAEASSPWVLLRARTSLWSAAGWMQERIDAWSPTGTHLGSAEQLRAVRAVGPGR